MNRRGPKIPPLAVTDAQRAVLEGWVRRRSTAQALALRSRIVPECAQGHSIMEVSRRLQVAPDTVRTWRRRFLDRGLDGLSDEPRPGVPRKITDADVERVIVRTLEEKPPNATHWSTRSMAAATGMSQSAVSRIWRAFALAPAPLRSALPDGHRVRNRPPLVGSGSLRQASAGSSPAGWPSASSRSVTGAEWPPRQPPAPLQRPHDPVCPLAVGDRDGGSGRVRGPARRTGTSSTAPPDSSTPLVTGRRGAGGHP
ncbi:helix-turn-helix domain-containing protein [Streptomyces sparsogenes]|uniref:helix-turn-helix domain-containing protein n=1 Tax=Streptomyces sparsogenes TaxID=67365 RepID=UPI0034002D48